MTAILGNKSTSMYKSVLFTSQRSIEKIQTWCHYTKHFLKTFAFRISQLSHDWYFTNLFNYLELTFPLILPSSCSKLFPFSSASLRHFTGSLSKWPCFLLYLKKKKIFMCNFFYPLSASLKYVLVILNLLSHEPHWDSNKHFFRKILYIMSTYIVKTSCSRLSSVMSWNN